MSREQQGIGAGAPLATYQTAGSASRTPVLSPHVPSAPRPSVAAAAVGAANAVSATQVPLQHQHHKQLQQAPHQPSPLARAAVAAAVQLQQQQQQPHPRLQQHVPLPRAQAQQSAVAPHMQRQPPSSPRPALPSPQLSSSQMDPMRPPQQQQQPHHPHPQHHQQQQHKQPPQTTPYTVIRSQIPHHFRYPPPPNNGGQQQQQQQQGQQQQQAMSKADKKLAMWNKDTDLVLRDLVLRQGEVDWAKIASTIEWDTGTVSAKECQGRWEAVKETPVKGPWSNEEDEHLKRLVDIYGAKKWNLLARAFPGRSGKQCRERWHNHVDERVKKGEWTAEEDQILCEAQRQLGNKWSEMSRILQGRSENAIKNRFNSLNAKGLTETRANELLSKVGPAALASTGSYTPSPRTYGEGRQDGGYEYDHSSISNNNNNSNNNDNDTGRSVRGGGPSGGRSYRCGENGGGVGGVGVGGSSGGVGGSGGGTGGGRGRVGGGSAAMHALMVTVTEEREACEFGEDDGDHCCDPREMDQGSDVSADEEEEVMGRQGRRVGDRGYGESWGGRAGSGGVGAGAGGSAGGRRGTKRDREVREGAEKPCIDVCIEGRKDKAESGRRMKGSPQGMSILARAAGLLESEDDDGSFVGSASGFGSSSGGGGGGGGGSCSKDDATSDGSTSALDPRSMDVDNDSNENKTSAGGAHGSKNSNQNSNKTGTNANSGSGGSGVGRGSGIGSAKCSDTIDHGSTPPGSASPPPSAMASGGADAAVGGGGGNDNGNDNGKCGSNGRSSSGSSWGDTKFGTTRGVGGSGGGGGAADRNNDPVATAFAVAAGETVAIRSRVDGYPGGSSSSGCAVGSRVGGGYGWGNDSSPASGFGSGSPRSGWYIGPGGAYRRGLGSVPGPWRPYWRGEEGTGPSGGAATGQSSNAHVQGQQTV